MTPPGPPPGWSAGFAAIGGAMGGAVGGFCAAFAGAVAMWKGFGTPTAPNTWFGVVFVSLSNGSWLAAQGLAMGLWAVLWRELRGRGFGAAVRMGAVLGFVASALALQELFSLVMTETRTEYVTRLHQFFAIVVGLLELIPPRDGTASARMRIIAIQSILAGTVMAAMLAGWVGVTADIYVVNGLMDAATAAALLGGARLGLAAGERLWRSRAPRILAAGGSPAGMPGPVLLLALSGGLSGVLSGLFFGIGLLVAAGMLPGIAKPALAIAAFLVPFPVACWVSLRVIQSKGPDAGRLGALAVLGTGCGAGLLPTALFLGVLALVDMGYTLSLWKAGLFLAVPWLSGWCLWWASEAGWRSQLLATSSPAASAPTPSAP